MRVCGDSIPRVTVKPQVLFSNIKEDCFFTDAVKMAERDASPPEAAAAAAAAAGGEAANA